METNFTANPCGLCNWLQALLILFLSTIAYEASSAENSNEKYVHIPTKWVQIQVPDLRIKNVGRLIEGTGNATWGKNATVQTGDFEIGNFQSASDKGLKLLRDLSFDNITLKKGCLIVLTGYPNHPRNDYLVETIDCGDGIAIISGKQFSGVFDNSEVVVDRILAPTLGSLEVKESFKLPNGRLMKKGTLLKANGPWFPAHSTNVFEILPAPKGP